MDSTFDRDRQQREEMQKGSDALLRALLAAYREREQVAA